jgi:hypothetical protein
MHKITPTARAIFAIVHARANEVRLHERKEGAQREQAALHSPTPARERQRCVFFSRDIVDAQYQTRRAIQYFYPRGGFPGWEKVY